MAVLHWIPAGLNKAVAGEVGGSGRAYKLSTLTKAEVRNYQGEKLGEIEDFVMDAQSGKIALVIFSHQGIAGLGQKIKIIPYALLVFNEAERVFLLNVAKEDLIPVVKVKNGKGEALGEIEDLMIDSRGRILFAILTHKEKSVVIPLPALSTDRTGNFLILEVDEEKLASAPLCPEDSVSETQGEEIYRYFGQQSPWEEGKEEFSPEPKQLVPLPQF